MENKKGRRNSILKTRVTVDVLSETVDNNVPVGPAQNRRVSFHNMKQIQEYDRHHGQMIEGTPIKEKITDTLGSDGILTPRGGNMDITNVLEHNSTFQVFNNGGAADMSLETTVTGGGEEEENQNDETARLFNVTRDKTIYYEEVVETTKTTKTKITKITGASGAAPGSSDDTMSLFNQSNMEEVDMSMDRPANDTMAIFNQTNSDEIDMDMSQSATFAVPKIPRHQNKTINRTLPMDLEDVEENQTKKANETMSLFNVSNLESTDMDISHNPAQQSILHAPNDTISMFRSPAPKKQVFQEQHVEMDISQVQEAEEPGAEAMDISQAPPTPSHAHQKKNATMALFEEDDNMDITQNTTIIKETTVEKINESCHMDISSVTTSVCPDVQSQTMALFGSAASPAREKMAVPTADSPKDHDKTADATLKMFQSPARQAGNELRMPTSAQKTMVFEESMDIEESTIHVESVTSPTSEEPEDPVAPEVPESAESKTPETSPLQDFESSFHQSLHERSVMLEQSVLEEERAAVLQNSMMEVMPKDDQEEEEELVDVGEIQKTLSSFVRREEQMEEDVSMDISHQKTPQKSMHRPKSVQDASTILNETSVKPMEEEEPKNESMVKTMQISTDTADVTRTIQEEEETSGHPDGLTEELQETVQLFTSKLQVESTELGDEVSIQMAMEESTIQMAQNQSRMSQTSFNESYSIRNTSRRRRSLLRDTLVRESPRRVALENSMHITMHMPNHYGKEDGRLTALAEYRQNKSLLNASQEMNETDGSNGTMTAGASSGNGSRDIYAMNTSIRSPRNTTINKSINLNTPRVPSPISVDQSSVVIPPPESPFQPMPIYDPAVVNVLYLTADDGTAHPEAADFQAALMAEKQGLEKIQNSEDGGAVQYSNLTKQDVRDVMLLAREEAEIQFLELRLKFATEHSEKQTRCIEQLTSENSEMAEQIRDAQNLPEIKKEIEKLRIEKTQYTKTEVRQIRQDYMYWRKKMFDAQMAALQHNYEVGLAIADQRAELRMEVEEFEERAAQIQEKNRQERRELVDQILKIMEEW